MQVVGSSTQEQTCTEAIPTRRRRPHCTKLCRETAALFLVNLSSEAGVQGTRRPPILKLTTIHELTRRLGPSLTAESGPSVVSNVLGLLANLFTYEMHRFEAAGQSPGRKTVRSYTAAQSKATGALAVATYGCLERFADTMHTHILGICCHLLSNLVTLGFFHSEYNHSELDVNAADEYVPY